MENVKPHPDHLLSICKFLEVNPQEIVVIGDTHRDIRGAKEVNALSIAVKTKISHLTDSSNIEYFYKAERVIEENEIPAKLIEALNDMLQSK